jgi:hypothetical protein
MPSGEFQLIAMGPQDFYLTGNPSITFFKSVYRRYSNFSMEMIELPFNNLPDFQNESQTLSKCKIDRNGELVHDTYIRVKLPAIYTKDIPFKWIDNLGSKLVEEVSIFASGAQIDKQFGEYMFVEKELSYTDEKKYNYDRMINGNNINGFSGLDTSKFDTNFPVIPGKLLLIPLNFWFCKNSGQSIPLVALQYTPMTIDILFNKMNELYLIGNPPISPYNMFSGDLISTENAEYKEQLINEGWSLTTIFNRFYRFWNQDCSLLANYIYIDGDDKKKFAAVSHEYLIKQGYQRRIYLGLMRGPNTLRLALHHPVTELIWFLRKSSAVNFNDWFNFTDRSLIGIVQIYNKTIYNSYLLNENEIKINSGTNNEITIDQNLIDAIIPKLNTANNFILTQNNSEIIDQKNFDLYSIMRYMNLKFNGNDRFGIREKEYFQNLQVFKYHSGTGKDGLYVYSFSLQPEEDQPSGSCNMSRISDQQFYINIYETENNIRKLDKFDLHLYAPNYNVFRIMGGIGSIVFSN